MKILIVSDEESSYYWDYYQKGRLDDIDLILSCGDLKAEYLEFLVTMSHAPLLYVPGNHDRQYEKHPPEGCDCIDGKLVNINGLRILGLGGSRQYNGGPNQYTEKQMSARIFKAKPKLRKNKGVDIVLTHAPASGCGDAPDVAHAGFECFCSLMDRYKPKYLIHGHVHKRYGPSIERLHQYGETKVINASGYYILEV